MFDYINKSRPETANPMYDPARNGFVDTLSVNLITIAADVHIGSIESPVFCTNPFRNDDTIRSNVRALNYSPRYLCTVSIVQASLDALYLANGNGGISTFSQVSAGERVTDIQSSFLTMGNFNIIGGVLDWSNVSDFNDNAIIGFTNAVTPAQYSKQFMITDSTYFQLLFFIQCRVSTVNPILVNFSVDLMEYQSQHQNQARKGI